MRPTLAFLACLTFSNAAFAQMSPDPEPAPAPVATSGSGDNGNAESSSSGSKDVRREVPIVAYTYSASGVTAKTYGVQLYGLGLVASGQDRMVGGGGAVWGSPI